MGDHIENKATIANCILWVLGYFCIMLLYTYLDIILWRRGPSIISEWLNILTIIAFSYIYIAALTRKWNLDIKEMLHINIKGFLIAVSCAILFFIMLDCFLDPIIENAFPISEESYQDTLVRLKENGITSFIQVCIISPIVEEILMRGFVLGKLAQTYTSRISLLISVILFAALHFNMVQTLSAIVPGVVLGLLYLKTKSLASTIVAHALYNTLSFISLFLLL